MVSAFQMKPYNRNLKCISSAWGKYLNLLHDLGSIFLFWPCATISLFRKIAISYFRNGHAVLSNLRIEHVPCHNLLKFHVTSC